MSSRILILLNPPRVLHVRYHKSLLNRGSVYPVLLLFNPVYYHHACLRFCRPICHQTEYTFLQIYKVLSRNLIYLCVVEILLLRIPTHRL